VHRRPSWGIRETKQGSPGTSRAIGSRADTRPASPTQGIRPNFRRQFAIEPPQEAFPTVLSLADRVRASRWSPVHRLRSPKSENSTNCQNRRNRTIFEKVDIRAEDTDDSILPMEKGFCRKLDAKHSGDGRRDRTRACCRSVHGAYQGRIHVISVSGVSRRRRGSLLPFQMAESAILLHLYDSLSTHRPLQYFSALSAVRV